MNARKKAFILIITVFSIQSVFGMYHQKMGRFMTHDPLGVQPAGGVENLFYAHLQYVDGFNLYEYVQDRVLFYTDPMGLSMVYPGVPSEIVTLPHTIPPGRIGQGCRNAGDSPEVQNCLARLSKCMENDPIKDDIDRAVRGDGVNIQVCDVEYIDGDANGDYGWRPWPFKDRIRLKRDFECKSLLHEISHFEDGYIGRWQPGKSEDKAYDYGDNKYYKNGCDKIECEKAK